MINIIEIESFQVSLEKFLSEYLRNLDSSILNKILNFSKGKQINSFEVSKLHLDEDKYLLSVDFVFVNSFVKLKIEHLVKNNYISEGKLHINQETNEFKGTNITSPKLLPEIYFKYSESVDRKKTDLVVYSTKSLEYGIITLTEYKPLKISAWLNRNLS